MRGCNIGGEELNALFFTEAAWRTRGTKDSRDEHAFLRMVQDEWVAQNRGDSQVSKSLDFEIKDALE